MPELPEVETVVRGLLQSNIVGKTITEVHIRFPKLILDPKAFVKDVVGSTISACTRRAKYILLTFNTGKTLLIHLRMTGKLLIVKKNDELSAHEHAQFTLDDGRQIRFHDVRKFGRFYLTSDANEFLADLGLEMLDEDFSFVEFCKRIGGAKRSLKTVLLDQKVIAGLGNIYADEVLFQARLLPQRKACTLSKHELKALCDSIQQVLRSAIERGGSSLGSGLGNFLNSYGQAGKNQNQFSVYQRTNLPCLLCQSPIQRVVMGQRSTHFCPHCQK